MNKVVMHIMGMESSKYGGIEHFNVALATTLRTHGYDTVFVYESTPSSQQFLDDMASAGGEIVVCNSRSNRLRFCWQIAHLIRRYQPVIVHSHFTKARFMAMPIARMLGVKCLYFTMHSELEQRYSIKLHTWLWYRWANRVSKVITVSEAIKQQYLALWPNAKAECIYMGVRPVEGDRDACRAELGISSDTTMVMTTANFNHIKGLDTLCEAVSILIQQDALPANTLFYIVGQPPSDIEQLSAIAKQIGVADKICMVGISNRVATYLRAADIYVQPSRSEGISLALIEAASAGLPLIGSRVGGIPEVIAHQKNGLLVDPSNSSQLSEAIKVFLHDPTLRLSMEQKSTAIYHSKFSLTSATNHLINYYNL